MLRFVSFAALAGGCVYSKILLPKEIEISTWQALSAERTWRAVAEEMESYGNAYLDVEGPVVVNLKLSFQPATLMEMGPKTCGETLKDRANQTADAAAVANAGGGDGGGIVDGGSSGTDPVGQGPYDNCFSQPGGGGCVSVGGGEYHCEAQYTELVCNGA